MTATIQDTDLGLKRIQRELEKAKRQHVSIGWHEDKAHGDGMTTATVAASHEFGIGVPQRAMLATTIDDKGSELVELAGKVYAGPLFQGTLDAERALGIVGEAAQAAIQAKIRDGDPSWAPLSPATIKRKKSSKPLIDTGQMIQSVRYKVEKGPMP
jgi:hypothetical protein